MVKENEALLHITISKELKEKLEAYKEGSGLYSTLSDFIREAIRDKVRRMENPELNRSSVQSEILSKVNKQEKQINLLLEQIKTIKEIDTTSTSLKALTLNGLSKELIDLKKEKIHSVMETKQLSVKDIKQKTGFDRIVTEILNRYPRDFKLNLNNGKWRSLKND